jgi:hypothetical protein
MVDISITATAVTLISGPTARLNAGATIAAGQLVYKEAVTDLAKLSDNDNATSAIRAVYGIALNGGATGQPILIALNGAVVDLGAAVLTAGTDYYLSGTPGGLAPRADVTTGDDTVRVGMATTTSRIQLDISDPGVTL